MVEIHIYEVRLKSNGTDFTEILFPKNILKSQLVPFKIVSLQSHTLVHPLLLRFDAPLEGFFWNAPELHHHGPFDGLHIRKLGPLDHPLERGK